MRTLTNFEVRRNVSMNLGVNRCGVKLVISMFGFYVKLCQTMLFKNGKSIQSGFLMVSGSRARIISQLGIWLGTEDLPDGNSLSSRSKPQNGQTLTSAQFFRCEIVFHLNAVSPVISLQLLNFSLFSSCAFQTIKCSQTGNQ